MVGQRVSPRLSAADLAAGVAEVLDPVWERLTRLSQVVLACHHASGGRLTDEALGPVADEVLAVLPSEPRFEGMGYVAELRLVAGSEERFMSWWQLRGGRPVRLRLDLDATSPDLFDYSTMAWFTDPREQRARTVVGPYVDFSCSDLFTATITVPVVDGATFLGICGADLQFLAIERDLTRVLRRSDLDACVVDASRRVIAVNCATWLVADRLPTMPTAGEGGVVDVVTVPGDFGWQLVTRWPAA